MQRLQVPEDPRPSALIPVEGLRAISLNHVETERCLTEYLKLAASTERWDIAILDILGALWTESREKIALYVKPIIDRYDFGGDTAPKISYKTRVNNTPSPLKTWGEFLERGLGVLEAHELIYLVTRHDKTFVAPTPRLMLYLEALRQNNKVQHTMRDPEDAVAKARPTGHMGGIL